MVEVAAEKNSTLVLPFPVEMLRYFEAVATGTRPYRAVVSRLLSSTLTGRSWSTQRRTDLSRESRDVVGMVEARSFAEHRELLR